MVLFHCCTIIAYNNSKATWPLSIRSTHHGSRAHGILLLCISPLITSKGVAIEWNKESWCRSRLGVLWYKAPEPYRHQIMDIVVHYLLSTWGHPNALVKLCHSFIIPPSTHHYSHHTRKKGEETIRGKIIKVNFSLLLYFLEGELNI